MEEKAKTEPTQMLRCPVCGMEFSTQEKLDEHNTDMHGKKNK